MSEEVSSGAVFPTTGTKESVARGAAPSQEAAPLTADAETAPPKGVHPSEELLEQFCLGQLVDPSLALFEEHLLHCPVCCTRVADMDDYLVVMKAGLAEAAASDAIAGAQASPEPIRPIEMPVAPGLGRTWYSGAALSSLLKIAAVVVFVFSATVAWNAAKKAAPVAEAQVSLMALRGGEETLPVVPAGSTVRLDIDPSALPPASEYRAQVVDATGHAMWDGTAPLADQKLSFRVQRTFKPGEYWVRLYATGSGDLLREFALRVQ